MPLTTSTVCLKPSAVATSCARLRKLVHHLGLAVDDKLEDELARPLALAPPRAHRARRLPGILALLERVLEYLLARLGVVGNGLDLVRRVLEARS